MNRPMPGLHEMPGHLIRRVQQFSNALFGAECAAFDLTSVQYAALTMIGQHTGLDATRLSSLIALDRSTIGGVLDGWRPRPGSRGIRVRAIVAFGCYALRRPGKVF